MAVRTEPVPPAAEAPLYQTLLAWSSQQLAGRGYGRPFCKRLAVLLAGLLAGERPTATLGGLAARVHGLAVSPAAEPSVLRRLQRLLDDARLAPERALTDALTTLVPRGLAPLLAARAGDPSADRTPWLRLIVDETSVADRLHILVLGLGLPGLVLPLAVRCWRQNATLPDGAYWTALSGACWQVRALLPAAVQGHVLLLADRAYGVPQLIDLCSQLGWGYAVRVQGGVRVRLTHHRAAMPLRALVPRPGTGWYGGWALAEVTGAADAPDGAWVFRKAGWRRCQVVAAWAPGQPEPWLLLTTLPARPAQLQEYARRWAIERLFLHWKSHGWDLEACGLADAARLERLVTGLALATWWRLAFALPTVTGPLAALGAPRRGGPRQLRLPGLGGPSRPWLARRSLLAWGAQALLGADLRTRTPPYSWALPPWTAPTWTALCQAAANP